MKPKIRRQLAHRKRRVRRRLEKANVDGCLRPVFPASDIRYEIADRTRAIGSGGIGAELRQYDTSTGAMADGFADLAKAIEAIKKSPNAKCEFVLPVKTPEKK